MNSTLAASLAAGVLAAVTLAAPAEAGFKGHHGHHGHHFHGHHKHFFHKFHVFRSHYYRYEPECVKHRWIYSHGYKKWTCVLWR